jgi:hypothetical protein
MIAVALLAIAFAAGALAGVAVLLRLGISREDSRRSLRGYPETRSAAATRRVLGLYASMPPGVSAPGNPGGPAGALQARGIQAVPWRQSPRQLPAPRPGVYRDGLR